MITVENTLRLSFLKDPVTLDPQQSGDPVSSAAIFLLFKGLTRLEPDQSIICDLADSYQILDDGKKYVFQLGRHFWSDGTPITAHDFEYSWKRALSRDFPTQSMNFFSPIKHAVAAKKGLISMDRVGVSAKDDATLIVELENPCPYFLELTSFCPLFPISSKADKNDVTTVCSGAFQIECWKKGESLILKRNPYSNPSARIDGIAIKIVPDEKEAFRLFENDELDWIGDPISPLPLNYLPSLVLNKKIRPITGMVNCWFNTQAWPFSNPHLRKALAYVIPRKELLEKLLLPGALLADRLCPSLIPEEQSLLPEVDLNKAKELFKIALTELNVKHLRITLSHEATDVFSRLAALLKGYWAEAFDVKVTLEPLSFKDYFQRLLRKQFQAGLLRMLSQHSDPINFLERFESGDQPKNLSGWENVKYQALLSRYHKTTCPVKRQAIAVQAEKILLEHMPIAPIYYSHYAYLQKPYVHHCAISPAGIVHFDRVTMEEKLCFEEDDALQGVL